jgi:AhpC/TSA family/Thiol:disulfide interchange protein DsbD, N-terminal
VQLQRNLDQFNAANVALFAISYDPVDAQAAFADEHGITFPLLADPDHAAIEATGILNTLIEPHEAVYGIPFPGTYVIGTDGTIEEKLFFANYRSRPSAATVLRDGFGIDFEIDDHPHADIQGDGVKISATLGGESMVFGEVATLYIDIDLDDGLHLYGQSVPDGFIATELTITAPERVRVSDPHYPSTVPFNVEGIDETFAVFEPGPIRVTATISNGIAEGDSFPLDIAVRCQACTDRRCFLPQDQTLQLQVPLTALNRRPQAN